MDKPDFDKILFHSFRRNIFGFLFGFFIWLFYLAYLFGFFIWLYFFAHYREGFGMKLYLTLIRLSSTLPDTENITFVFDAVKDTVLRENLSNYNLV